MDDAVGLTRPLRPLALAAAPQRLCRAVWQPAASSQHPQAAAVAPSAFSLPRISKHPPPTPHPPHTPPTQHPSSHPDHDRRSLSTSRRPALRKNHPRPPDRSLSRGRPRLVSRPRLDPPSVTLPAPDNSRRRIFDSEDTLHSSLARFMAAQQYGAMGSRPTLKTENFDMDSFFDFNQGGTQPSPINPSSSRPDATPQAANQDWNSLSPFDQPEERQHFNGPSHDYNQYKQQVGLPLGSIQSMPMQPQMMDGFNSGIDMNMEAGFGNGWSSGIDIDSEMGMDFNQPQQTAMPPPMFFPANGNDASSANFVNPTTLGGQEEPPSNVGRLWPGMHSQQAQQLAMQKAAQTQAMQQRQMKLQAQQQQYRQAANAAQSQSQGSSAQQQSHGNGKRPSHATEPHVEESISRLLNQMRNNSTAASDDAGSPDNLLPQIARMRKDEEEMDEDERLLASEEGKKLSSKERRQLRNKVSARAFRSRRKGMLLLLITLSRPHTNFS